MSRDDQFAGFAMALNEKLTISRLVAQDSPAYDPVVQCRNELQITAQCAYDLVAHTIKYLGDNPEIEDCLSCPDEPISYIPDMTTWPEEANK